MRTYQELIDDATLTGTFNNYVGDGASVPWQVALPFSVPLGLTLWAYKAYLDASFPLAFKLHDWCYTPYGTLISVTREEADAAMRDIIALTSPADAAVVYAAVRAAGDPYFGVSQTGYNGPQSQGVSANIGLPSGVKVSSPSGGHIFFNQQGAPPMVATRAILKFNGATIAANPRPSIGYVGSSHAFGFSESIWRNGLTIPQTVTYLKNHLGPARASLLPVNASLTSATLYSDTGGGGVDVPLGFTGTQGTTNVVNDAILCETRNAAAPIQRRWWVHCVPDEWVTQGELRIDLIDSMIIQLYLSKMALGDWVGVVQNDLKDIVTITAQGLVTLSTNQPYAVGQHVRVTRTLNSSKKKVGGDFMVSTVGPLLTQFTLALWNKGDCTGGKVYRPTYDYYSLGANEGPYVVRGGTRRIGRPFELYRGRQPART